MPPKRSPPKYRHDGTSPLPLGMDWSPPPKKWAGKDTVWPHDPHSGWSYCVTIPSWIIQPESGASDDSLINPIVFYRVQVGIQSPEGISTARGLLRRFSDFLKLFSALKKVFPKKSIPAAPPKHALLRINSSRLLLEERRYALEEWMGKLLSDIEISRSVHVASFLELEAAARSSFQDVNHHSLETNPSIDKFGVPSALQIRANSSASITGSSLVASTTQSVASDCGSDNAYEASEPETPIRGRGHNSEIGTEDISFIQDLSSPIGELVKYGVSGHDSGLLVGETIVGQSEEIARSKMKIIYDSTILGRDVFYGNSSGERMEFTAEHEQDKLSSHARKHSAESIGSDISSVRGSELSNPGVSNSTGDGFGDLPGGLSSVEMQFPVDAHIVLPLDQQHKLNRVLLTMQRRLVTAKTDMEDLIARLNQEMAVKEYLSTKVKDLEVELESTKQRSKENLKQAILVERERITQMQWDMDEFRRKFLEMESKLKFEENERNRVETERTSAIAEKEILLRELDIKREKLENLQKHFEGLEMKSKGDIKVLVKEVKFLRNSQAELKDTLNESMKEKNELERVLRKEKERWRHTKLARKKLLHECGVLRQRLQECSVNFFAEEEDPFSIDASSLSDALGLLTTSDNRIGLLLAEAQLLARDDENDLVELEKGGGHESDEVHGNNITTANGDDFRITDDEVRKTLADILIDNAKLRRQINSVIRRALKTVFRSERGDGGDGNASRKTVLNKFLER